MAEVGKLSIGIEGDTSKLEKDVAAAKQKIDSSGTADAGEKAAAKAAAARAKEVEQLGVVGAKLKEVKKTYGEQIEVVQGLIGKIAAIGGTAVIAFNVGQSIKKYIVETLESGAEAAKDFQASMTSMDASVRLEGTKKQISEVEGQLAAAMEDADANASSFFRSGTLDAIYKRKIEQLKEQLGKLRNDAKTQEDFVNKFGKGTAEEREAEDKKKSDARAKEQADILDKLDEQGRAGRQRIDDEQQKRREQFEDFQAQMAEMDRKAAEAAKKVQESWSNAFRAIREENNRAFATDQAASMVQFAQQMKLEGMLATSNMNRIVVEGVG